MNFSDFETIKILEIPDFILEKYRIKIENSDVNK